jgi:hypothetical protein
MPKLPRLLVLLSLAAPACNGSDPAPQDAATADTPATDAGTPTDTPPADTPATPPVDAPPADVAPPVDAPPDGCAANRDCPMGFVCEFALGCDQTPGRCRDNGCQSLPVAPQYCGCDGRTLQQTSACLPDRPYRANGPCPDAGG